MSENTLRKGAIGGLYYWRQVATVQEIKEIDAALRILERNAPVPKASPAAQTVAVPDVQVTTTVDAIDAGDHEFIDVLAARVGMRGKVEHKRFEQSDGGVIVLWDGPNLGAVALTVRDDFNRTKCMTVNLLSAPATPEKVEDDVAIPPGWEFYSADFSLRSNGRQKLGSAVLIRDAAGRNWWHALSGDQKERIDLYLCGGGETVNAAIADAVSKTLSAAQAKEGGA